MKWRTYFISVILTATLALIIFGAIVSDWHAIFDGVAMGTAALALFEVVRTQRRVSKVERWLSEIEDVEAIIEADRKDRFTIH